MGQNNSKAVFNYNRTSLDLIDKIQKRAAKLKEDYTYEFLDENFCNKIALLHNDQLTKFKKQEIDGVRYTLGIVNDDPRMKEKVCKQIVDHYVRRLKLIAKIETSIDYAINRIYAITVGPRCDGYPDTFDEKGCRDRGGRWTQLVTMPEDIVENRQWFQQVHDMQRDYINYLKRLDSMLVQLDDFDDYVNDERLKALETEFEKLRDRINTTTFERHRLAASTKTFTRQEVATLRANQMQSQAAYAAQQSAMRLAHGLPPLKYR